MKGVATMLRQQNYYGIAKEYKNHNITLKIPKNELADFMKDDILFIQAMLGDIDCDFIGETFCLNNFETGHTVYNSYSDMIYTFPWRYIDDLKKGKTVRLYASKPDEWDRELLERELPWWEKE